MRDQTKTETPGVYLLPSGKYLVVLRRGEVRRVTAPTLAEAVTMKLADKASIKQERNERLVALRENLRLLTEDKAAKRRVAAATKKEARQRRSAAAKVLSGKDGVLRYHPETGQVIRNGKVVGKRKDRRGYVFVSVRVDGESKTRSVHRFAFFYMNGVWPVGPIDHINGIKDDNRWVNLRETTQQENNANVAVPAGRQVCRLNGKYYPLLTGGYDCPHEATLVAEALGALFRK